MTIVSWLNLYLQVDALKDVPKVLLPQYSQEKFIQIAQVGSELSKNAFLKALQAQLMVTVPKLRKNALLPHRFLAKKSTSLTLPENFILGFRTSTRVFLASALMYLKTFLYIGKLRIHLVFLITVHCSVL